MLGFEDFTWKGNKLYLGKKSTGFSVFNADESLYWMKWPDGKVSADFYNLSRAKDNCISQAALYFNNTEKGTS